MHSCLVNWGENDRRTGFLKNIITFECCLKIFLGRIVLRLQSNTLQITSKVSIQNVHKSNPQQLDYLHITACCCYLSRHQSQSSLKRKSHGSPGDSPGYSTVGEPSTASHSFSLPPHSVYPSELDEDQFISPYASFTSLSERPVPILSGWLDKLSPQGYALSGLLLSSCLCISSLLKGCLCLLSILSCRFVYTLLTFPEDIISSFSFTVFISILRITVYIVSLCELPHKVFCCLSVCFPCG